MVRRPYATAAALVVVPMVVVLSLSDRAPGSTLRIFGDLHQVGVRIVQFLGLDIGPVQSPFSLDAVFHLGLWAVVGFIGRRLARDRWSTITVLWALVLASFGFELGQVFLTASRNLQATDMVANILGVLVGVTAAHALGWYETRAQRSEDLAPH